MQARIQDVVVTTSSYGAWRLAKLEDHFPHNNIDEP